MKNSFENDELLLKCLFLKLMLQNMNKFIREFSEIFRSNDEKKQTSDLNAKKDALKFKFLFF